MRYLSWPPAEAARTACGTPPADSGDALSKIDRYQGGGTGNISYIDSGDPIRRTVVLQIEGGSIEFRTRIDPREPDNR